MVQYRCDVCCKTFGAKGAYLSHLTRKTPCKTNFYKDTVPKTFFCTDCHREFSRKDCLNKHVCKPITVKNKISKENTICGTTNTNNNTNANANGNANTNINGNGNKSIVNNFCINYNLAPFCKEDINCLTLAEKIEVLNSDNVLETIIIRVNFNPDKINNHNFFYKDVKNGYGMIYDGKTWKKERINCILELLCEAREQNLKDIYAQIDFYLSAEDKTQIKQVLDKVNKLIKPRFEDYGKKDKNIFFAHLKKHMVNNSILGETAMENTVGLSATELVVATNKPKILQNSTYTIADIERDMRLNAQLKEISLYLITILLKDKIIDFDTYTELSTFVSKTPDNSHIRCAISAFTNAILFNKSINMDIVNNYIDQNNIINNYVDKHFV